LDEDLGVRREAGPGRLRQDDVGALLGGPSGLELSDECERVLAGDGTDGFHFTAFTDEQSEWLRNVSVDPLDVVHKVRALRERDRCIDRRETLAGKERQIRQGTKDDEPNPEVQRKGRSTGEELDESTQHLGLPPRKECGRPPTDTVVPAYASGATYFAFGFRFHRSERPAKRARSVDGTEPPLS